MSFDRLDSERDRLREDSDRLDRERSFSDPYPIKPLKGDYRDLPLRDPIPLPEERNAEARPLDRSTRFGDILDSHVKNLEDRYNLPYGRPRPIDRRDDYERPYYMKNWHADHTGEPFHRPIDRHRDRIFE